MSLEAASITEKSLFDDSRIGFYLFHLGQPQQVNVNPLLGFNPSGDPGDPRDYVWLYQGQPLVGGSLYSSFAEHVHGHFVAYVPAAVKGGGEILEMTVEFTQ